MPLSPPPTTQLRSLPFLIAICGLLLIMTGFVFVTFRERLSAAAFLPVEATVALFSSFGSEEKKAFLPLLPVLASLPSFPGRAEVAIVTLANGKQGWAVFGDSIASHPGSRTRRGYPSVLTSGKEVDGLLEGKEGRLRGFPLFRALADAAPKDLPWFYLDTRALPASSHALDSLLRDLLRARPYVSVARAHGSWSLSVLAPPPGRAGQGPLPVLHSGNFAPLVAVTAREPTRIAHTFVQVLPEPQQWLLRGRMEQWAEETLGPDVSLVHDVLPLFSRAVSLEVSRTGSSLSPLARGETRETEILKRTIDRMHRSKARLLLTGKVERRTFDRGFTSVTLRAGEALPRETFHGWQIRETGSGASSLITGTSGKRFFMSTNRSRTETGIREEAENAASGILLPSRLGTPALRQAGGILDLSAIAPLLQEMDLPLKSAFFPVLSQANGSIAWSLEEQGGIWTLTLRGIDKE